MENLEKLEKELKEVEKREEEEEIKLQNNIFRFISTTNKNDIVDWNVDEDRDNYDIKISKDNLEVSIIIEGSYIYGISIRNSEESMYYYFKFCSNGTDDYKKGISIIEEKISQAKELEHKRLQKEQEKEKENIIKYCKERIAQYQSYNQIFG